MLRISSALVLWLELSFGQGWLEIQGWTKVEEHLGLVPMERLSSGPGVDEG